MAQIVGIGIDAVQIERFSAGRFSQHAIKRLFHHSEVAAGLALEGRQQEEYFASRFAAKEAFAKALGVGFTQVIPSEIAVLTDEAGKPHLQVEGKTASFSQPDTLHIHLSLTHEGPLALAFVVLEKRE